MSSRIFETFRHCDALYRICSDRVRVVKEAIIEIRDSLDSYIGNHPEFKTSLKPVKLMRNAPEAAVKMADAAALFDVGPMAAVAGTIAQMACETAVSSGAEEAIIENGGDSYFISPEPVVAAVFAGINTVGGKLAFKITSSEMPIGVCSSSSRLGHSLSFGNCDLVTCFAANNSIADAAATSICNRIKNAKDLEDVLNDAIRVKELKGIFAVKDDRIAIAGNICNLIKINEKLLRDKITLDEQSDDYDRIMEYYNYIGD